MKKYRYAILPSVVIIPLFYGWIMNVFYLAHSDSLTGFVLLRVLGVFLAPLGIVLGFIQ